MFLKYLGILSIIKFSEQNIELALCRLISKIDPMSMKLIVFCDNKNKIILVALCLFKIQLAKLLNKAVGPTQYKL